MSSNNNNNNNNKNNKDGFDDVDLENFKTKTGGIQKELGETMAIMRSNVTVIVDNMTNLQELESQTEDLKNSSNIFRKGAGRLRRKMCCRNYKMTAIIVVIILIILLFIFVPIIVRFTN